jgi:FkbM family methyltransferase
MLELLARCWGLCRSLLIYHAIPFRQSQLRALLSPLVPPGGLAFDLGAHVGNRVRALRSLGVRVIAVEPQPAYATLLRRLFGHDEGIVVVEAAIGEKAGDALLSVSDRHPTVSTLSSAWRDRVGQQPSFRRVDWNREIRVTAETLDTLIQRFGRPDFIKIDIEGSEAAALRGLSAPIKALSFEYVPGAPSEAAACIDILERLGPYRYNWSVGETMQLAFPEWLDAAGIRKFIAERQAGERSGDIYCRLAK